MHRTAGFMGPIVGLETLQERDTLLSVEVDLIYRMFKHVTPSENGKMLSGYMKNMQETVLLIALYIKVYSIQFGYQWYTLKTSSKDMSDFIPLNMTGYNLY
jgi:hypothetical protein